MIKLYFLELESGIVKAGFTHNGKRYISSVTYQNGARFVISGSDGDAPHMLSEAQSAAVDAFVSSGDFAVEYAAPIL